MSKNKIIALKKPGEFCEDPLTELLCNGAQWTCHFLNTGVIHWWIFLINELISFSSLFIFSVVNEMFI